MILLLGVLAAADQSAEPKQPVAKNARAATDMANPNDPVEKEYLKLLVDDDAAQAEADKWIREASNPQTSGTPLSKATLTARIEQRFAPVRKAYEDFLQRHPKHVRARIAYGSFLNDINEEDESVVQWEKAKEIDPRDPAVWNNLANHYGHRGPVQKAFEYYAKAIELAPDEPLYFQNLATTTYLFRKDAMEFYKIDERQVFDRALKLYRTAVRLDPKNFPLASDLAQSYYGIKPLRTDEALAAWDYALKIANDAIEREGVYLHIARVELNSGRFEDARKHLGSVTNQMYTALKGRLLKNLVEKEKKARGTNTTPEKVGEPK